MKTLSQIQTEHREWTNYNFPGAPDHQSLIGTMEEMGELSAVLMSSMGKLSHAWLKREQGIRGNNHDAEAKDAIGDIMIYLMHFCSENGWSMEEIINETWEHVKQRDWVKFSENGVDK